MPSAWRKRRLGSLRSWSRRVGTIAMQLGQKPSTLNIAGVPVDSEWRLSGRTYYHPDIHEVPNALPSPSAQTFESSEQPLAAQAALPFPAASKGSSQAGDQVLGAKGAKDKGKGKETEPPLEVERATAKVKEVEARTKEADHKAKDALKAKDPPPS